MNAIDSKFSNEYLNQKIDPKIVSIASIQIWK